MEGLSGILEVVIGLAFIFLLLSLLVSAAVEYLEMWLRKRGRLLRFGLMELLDQAHQTSKSDKLVDDLYRNPLIYSLYKKDRPDPGGPLRGGNLPSYIPPNAFALALIDELSKQDGTAGTPVSLNSAADVVGLVVNSSKISDRLKSALRVVLSQVPDDDYNLAIKKLEDWYSSATDRVSGWYKKHTQWLSLSVSLAIVVAINVDTVHLAQTLMVNSSLRTAIVQSADAYLAETDKATSENKSPQACSTDEQCEQQALARVKGLKTQLASLGIPIGWQSVDWDEMSKGDVLSKIFGWLLTTLALTFGAPFWFDVLNKFMSFRSAVKPRSASGGK